jgi:hypothetical protein
VSHGWLNDDEFVEQIDHWVYRAVNAGGHTFGDLVRRLPGVYPSCVVDSLRRHLAFGQIPLLRAARLISQSANAVSSSISCVARDGLPVPHPLDFDWRFSDEAVERILDEASLLSHHRGSFGVVGAPSVALKAGQTWTSGSVIAFDVNPIIVAALRQLNERVASLRCNVFIDEPAGFRLDVVVTDPPWYFDELCSALWFGHAICRTGGFVLASIPPLGTRPGIARERTTLIEFSSTLGLELIRIEAAELPYRSPPFEQNALRAIGVAGAPVDWRCGDLAVFAKRSSFRSPRPTVSSPVDSDWCDVSFSAAHLRVSSERSGGFSDPRLSSIIEGDVLPTVSRRDPRRKAAKVWTSGNRVFACSGCDIFRVVAKALASGHAPRARVEHHLGRRLAPVEVEMTNEAAMQLIRIVLSEERELWAYASETRDVRRHVFAS